MSQLSTQKTEQHDTQVNASGTGQPALPAPSPSEIFLTLAKISGLVIGGAYAIIPAMAAAFQKKGWMDERKFYGIFARAQMFPGPLALSTSILASFAIAGLRGAVAAFFGVLLPPFLALILVGGVIGTWGRTRIFQDFLWGAGAVVPGLVGSMVWKVSRQRAFTLRSVLELAVLTFALIMLPGAALPVLLGGVMLIYVERILWKS
ncbi:MAG: chromate transporter [Spirochaetaceae bacterium]|nr:chromate transporter [Spirochaetaceae bacterium]